MLLLILLSGLFLNHVFCFLSIVCSTNDFEIVYVYSHAGGYNTPISIVETIQDTELRVHIFPLHNSYVAT